MRRLLVVLVCAGLAVVSFAFPASAHATLASSSPANGATLSSSPSSIVLDFTEQPDPALSQVHLLDQTGKRLERSAPRAVVGKPRSLEVVVPVLPKGVYTVTWRVVSRVDGHITGGAFAFGVGVSPGAVVLPTQTVPTTPPPSALSVAGRWAFYAGLMLLVGAAWMWLFAFDGLAPALRPLAWVGLALAVLGVVGIGLAQASADGVSIVALLKTATGHALIWRLAPLALSLAGILAWRRLGSALAAAGAELSALAHVTFGHAGTGRIVVGKVALQWAHVTAAAIWLGGLVALLVGLRRAEPDLRARAVRRFSAVALFAIALLAASGVARAADEYGSLRLVWASTFGRMLLIKSGLLGIVAILGGVNRWRNVPRAHSEPRGLIAVSRAEIVIAAGVLVATGILTGVQPGQSIVASRARVNAGIVATASDFATTVRVRLEAVPGTPGPNRFTMSVTDYDTGKPISAPAVPLTFTFAGRPGVPSSTLRLRRAKDGTYTGTGSNLAFLGPWQVSAFIARGAESVQVALALATRVDENIQTIPGQPTIYTVQLTGNAAVQFYVEPGTPGSNEYQVHATFLQNEKQYEGLSDVSLVGTSGGQTIALETREFSPGHFIGDGMLAKGRWRFDVSVNDAKGEPIAAYFETTIR